jgi:hypothetical protein
MRLELEPQRKHDLPLQRCPTESCVGNRPAALTIYAGEGKVEVDLIEEIEDVGAKLNRGTFFF